MRTAIIGVGSIGTIVGALITKNGGQIELVDSYVDNVKALNEQGAAITGFMEVNVPVTAITPDQMTGKYDLVFITSKQTSNSEVLPHLLPFLHEKSIVCSLQNGVPEESLAAVVGPERTAGAAVGFGATWLGPGKSELTSSMKVMENFAFDLGLYTGGVNDAIREVQKVLGLAGHCDLLENLMGLRWSKLLMNATFSGMSTAVGCTFGEVLNDDRAIRFTANIANETIQVAKACGIRMEPMQGKDFTQLALNSQEDIDSKLPFYHDVWDQHEKLKASMLQDLEKGRRCEIDFINGMVCRKGREKGVYTPYNDMIVAIVKSLEQAGAVNKNKSALDILQTLAMALGHMPRA